MSTVRAVTTGAAITKSDSTVYTPPLRKLWIGGAGDVAIRTAGGSSLVLSAAAAGSVIEGIAIDKVLSTGTTASLIVGFRG